MPLTFTRVTSGCRSSLTPQDEGLRQRDGLVIVVCEEKSITTLSPGLTAIFCCIAGENAISTESDRKLLHRADIHVSDTHSHHEVAAASRSACIIIAGTASAWNVNARRHAVGGRSIVVPVPATYRRSSTASGNLLRLARDCRESGSTGAGDRRTKDLLHHLDALQAEWTACVSRCPGSTVARKRAVFLRLHRARNLIESCANDDLEISKLALAANYSIGHFITLFRMVFGETPYAAISRHRLANARCLLDESDLAVGEIAQSSGFSSPSSFTRAMKKHTGKSATEFRQALRNIA